MIYLITFRKFSDALPAFTYTKAICAKGYLKHLFRS